MCSRCLAVMSCACQLVNYTLANEDIVGNVRVSPVENKNDLELDFKVFFLRGFLLFRHCT